MSRKKKKHILEEPAGDAASESRDSAASSPAEPTTFEIPQATDEAATVEETEAVAVFDADESDLRPVAEDLDAPEAVESSDPGPLFAASTEDDAASESDPGNDTEAIEGESGGTAEISTERVVEAILFASDEPLTPAKIVSILGTGSAREVRKIIQTLNDDYAKAGHAYRIEEIAGGYQMLTLPEYNTWLRRLRQSRQDSKLSPAAMETLAVVAYKQPVVRAEVEAVRGVSAGEVLNRLRELGLIKIVGRAEDVGRPMLYGTTKHFLELFGLGSLEDLPAIEELQMPK